jgi:preprotein translocase subunit SecE
MNTRTELKQKKAFLEKAKWFGVLSLFSGAIFSNYFKYIALNPIIRGVASLLLITMALGLFLITEKGKKALFFFNESRLEIRKVIWPSRQKALGTTLAVLLITTLISIILWGLDGILVFLISLMTRLRFF